MKLTQKINKKQLINRSIALFLLLVVSISFAGKSLHSLHCHNHGAVSYNHSLDDSFNSSEHKSVDYESSHCLICHFNFSPFVQSSSPALSFCGVTFSDTHIFYLSHNCEQGVNSSTGRSPPLS